MSGILDSVNAKVALKDDNIVWSKLIYSDKNDLIGKFAKKWIRSTNWSILSYNYMQTKD